MTAAWLLSLAAWAALCLATDRHGPTGFRNGQDLPPRTQRALGRAGLLGQGLAAALCVRASGVLGLVDYFGLALACALAVVGLATWRPRGLPVVAGVGLAGGLAAMMAAALAG